MIFLSDDRKKKKYLIIQKKEFKKFFKELSKRRDIEVQIKLSQIFLTNNKTNFLELKNYIKILLCIEKKDKNIFLENINQKKILNLYNNLMNEIINIDFSERVLIKKIKKYEKILKKNLMKSIKVLKKNNKLFHTTRVNIKKYRYFCEMKEEILKIENKNISELKEIQNLLGETNDLKIMYETLKKFKFSQEIINHIKKIKNQKIKKSVKYVLKNLNIKTY